MASKRTAGQGKDLFATRTYEFRVS